MAKETPGEMKMDIITGAQIISEALRAQVRITTLSLF